jgi:hypothetical protein
VFPDEDDQSWDDIARMATAIPGGGGLAAMAAYGLNKLGERRAPKPGPDDTDSVRLIHASDLQSWSRFPRCQDADTVTYGQYRARMHALKQVRKRVRRLVRARQRIAVLDTDETVEYHTEVQPVPRSLLRRRARQAAFWRSIGAPALRSMRWRGGASGFTLPCPVRLRAIGAIAA